MKTIRKIRFKITPAVYVIFEKDGHVLLALRKNTGFEDGKYSLPAGHVEKGESPTAAMIREAKEEVGVDIEKDSLHFVHSMYKPAFAQSDEYVDIFFVCKKWKGDIVNKEPDKCEQLEWFSLSSLPENTIAYVREALRFYQQNIVYSELGWGHE